LENGFPEFGLVKDIVNISDPFVSSLGLMAAYILCATIRRRKVEKFIFLVYRVDACLIRTVDCHSTMCASI